MHVIEIIADDKFGQNLLDFKLAFRAGVGAIKLFLTKNYFVWRIKTIFLCFFRCSTNKHLTNLQLTNQQHYQLFVHGSSLAPR